jgi:hypothetical protein
VCNLRQNPRSEIRDFDPRQNEKAMVVDEQVEIFLPRVIIPLR